MTYSGYAHFDSDEFMGWIGEMGCRRTVALRRGAQRAARADAGDRKRR